MSMRNREVKSLENFLNNLHDPLISITQPIKRTCQFGQQLNNVMLTEDDEIDWQANYHGYYICILETIKYFEGAY